MARAIRRVVTGQEPWQRLQQWFQTSPTGLVAVALIVGVGAGLGAILFRYLIAWCTLVLTGHVDYAGVGREPNPFLPALGIWFVVLVMVCQPVAVSL